jgi:hypothetical protein
MRSAPCWIGVLRRGTGAEESGRRWGYRDRNAAHHVPHTARCRRVPTTARPSPRRGQDPPHSARRPPTLARRCRLCAARVRGRKCKSVPDYTTEEHQRGSADLQPHPRGRFDGLEVRGTAIELPAIIAVFRLEADRGRLPQETGAVEAPFGQIPVHGRPGQAALRCLDEAIGGLEAELF